MTKLRNAGNPISKDEVFQAANKMSREGKMPTILSVRKELGNRGSETTLQKYLKEWKEKLLNNQQEGCVFCNDIERYKAVITDMRNEILTMLRG